MYLTQRPGIFGCFSMRGRGKRHSQEAHDAQLRNMNKVQSENSDLILNDVQGV